MVKMMVGAPNFGSVNVCPSGQGSPSPCGNSLALVYPRLPVYARSAHAWQGQAHTHERGFKGLKEVADNTGNRSHETQAARDHA